MASSSLGALTSFRLTQGEADHVQIKREAGLPRMGTKVDLLIQFEDCDYWITIKKGLSQQKAKIVRGEIDTIVDHAPAPKRGKKNYVIFCVYGLKRLEIEHIKELKQYMDKINSSRSDVELCIVSPSDNKAEHEQVMAALKAYMKEFGMETDD